MQSDQPVHAAHPLAGPCVITGAAGFIGAHLCRRLGLSWQQNGLHQPIAVVRRGVKRINGVHGVTLRHADLLRGGQVSRAFKGAHAVVHLAHGHRGPELTAHVVDAAIAQGVKRFVHVSTMSVHGPEPQADAAHEATATIGRYGNDYCDSKAEQEACVQAAIDRGDLNAVILRPTVVYGPGSSFVQSVLSEARTGAVTWVDEGSGVCNAVHVDDVCSAIECALTVSSARGQAFFINADESISWRRFIETFAAAIEPAPRTLNLDSREARRYWALHRPAAVDGRWAARLQRHWASWVDRFNGRGAPIEPAPWPPLGRIQRETINVTFSNEKARSTLNWSPRYTFDEGARQTLADLAAQGALR